MIGGCAVCGRPVLLNPAAPVHGIDADGKVVVCRQLKRRYVLTFFQKLPPCLVGIEACASSHYWPRELSPNSKAA
jgi:transposase